MTPLSILHVFRAPVGDLYRHVLDLAREQIARGHRVGLIADSKTGGRRAQETLKELAPSLALGLTRVPIYRHIGPNDATILGHVMGRIAGTRADVVHGHGAKGGAYARLAFNASHAVRAYTPHGGSLLFGTDTTAGKFYLATEKLLMRRGELFLFESAYSAEVFRRKIGTPHGLVRVVHYGVSEKDFAPVKVQGHATDLVFLGDFRPVKGIDVLIDAIAKLNSYGRHVTATLVGDGPERDLLGAQVERLGLASAVRFQPAMATREAQTLGRIMVIPSRAEFLPYAVLEAAAAGMPLITTKVGGIPEIYGPLTDRLVAAQDVDVLAHAIARNLDQPEETAETARLLRERVSQLFSVKSMVDGVLSAYQSGLDRLRQSARR